MKGTRTWTEMRAELAPEDQSALDAAIVRRRVGDALSEVRKSLHRTQTDVATKAGMTQNNVSRLESGDDMLVSSIDRYMQAVGGSVRLVLVRPDGSEVEVSTRPTTQP
jgi:DNA-binding XRE family transcriptional regulator